MGATRRGGGSSRRRLDCWRIGVERFAAHGHLLAAVEEASHHDPEVERVYREAFERSVDATATLLAAGVAHGHYELDPRPVGRALMHLNALWTIWSRVLCISAPPARSLEA